MGSGEAGRAAGGDLTGTGFGAAGAGAGAGAATTVGFFAERCAADGDFGAGAGTGAGAGGLAGKGIFKPNGETVTIFGSTAARFINGSGN